MIKARLIVKRWEEDASRWPPARKAAIVFARVVREEGSEVDSEYYAVYGRGNILTGESAVAAIAAGVAEEVTE